MAQIILNKYRIENLLGEGGFGKVYKATHLQLNVIRAIKVLQRNEGGVDSNVYNNYIERFKLEAQIGARMDNPYTIRVYDFEQVEGTLILVMEYAPNGSLADLIEQSQQKQEPIGVEEAVHLIREAALGLESLHKQDFVHRDIKPSNIMLDAEGHAKIADFGLVQTPHGMTGRSTFNQGVTHPGTPAYMSPEQRDITVYLTPASDIYSLGLVFFELLTGRMFKNMRPGTSASSIRKNIPGWVEELVNKMLAVDPCQRPWDGTETAKLLEGGALAKPPMISIPARIQTPGIGSTRVWEKDGMLGLYVPAGEFWMGSSQEEVDQILENNPEFDPSWFTCELPQHRVNLEGYWIDQTPVTNAMFIRFARESGYKTDAEKQGSGLVYKENWVVVKGACWQHPQGPDSDIKGKEDHPALQVSWNDAQAYCAWAGRRLPSEAEWEKAARGTDGRTYPWGNQEPDKSLLNYNNNEGGTTRVGNYPKGASPYGALDMAGNVWEWVKDWYGEYPTGRQENPTGPSSGEWRVLRGGSWLNSIQNARSAYRNWYDPDDRDNDNGFRCARSQLS